MKKRLCIVDIYGLPHFHEIRLRNFESGGNRNFEINARGAQLQNCKKDIRKIALREKGFSIDLSASFPALLTGEISEIARTTCAQLSMRETTRMIRDTKQWRADIARELGTSIAAVKKGVNAILFGMDLRTWRRRQGIREHARSPSIVALEKEVEEARVLVVRNEERLGRGERNAKPTRTLSRAIERLEVRVMHDLSVALMNEGWETTTLIHDEIIVTRSDRQRSIEEKKKAVERAVGKALRCIEEERGWTPGTLHTNTARL